MRAQIWKQEVYKNEDLCKIIEKIIKQHPCHHIFNVGNEELVDINTFVSLCYKVANKKLETVNVYHHENQRDYFSFYDYEYVLDVSRQKSLLPESYVPGYETNDRYVDMHVGEEK